MSDYEMFTCPAHGSEWPSVTKTQAEELGVPYGCQDCQRHLELTPVPESAEDRAAQLRQIMGTDEPGLGAYAGFDAVWQRTDELVGRSTFTHELAYPEYLEHEILTGNVPSMEGIVAKFPHDKPVFVVAGPEEE